MSNFETIKEALGKHILFEESEGLIQGHVRISIAFHNLPHVTAREARDAMVRGLRRKAEQLAAEELPR